MRQIRFIHIIALNAMISFSCTILFYIYFDESRIESYQLFVEESEELISKNIENNDMEMHNMCDNIGILWNKYIFDVNKTDNYLVWSCINRGQEIGIDNVRCSGVSDQIQGMVHTLLTAMISNRKLLIWHEHPISLNNVLSYDSIEYKQEYNNNIFNRSHYINYCHGTHGNMNLIKTIFNTDLRSLKYIYVKNNWPIDMFFYDLKHTNRFRIKIKHSKFITSDILMIRNKNNYMEKIFNFCFFNYFIKLQYLYVVNHLIKQYNFLFDDKFEYKSNNHNSPISLMQLKSQILQHRQKQKYSIIAIHFRFHDAYTLHNLNSNISNIDIQLQWQSIWQCIINKYNELQLISNTLNKTYINYIYIVSNSQSFKNLIKNFCSNVTNDNNAINLQCIISQQLPQHFSDKLKDKNILYSIFNDFFTLSLSDVVIGTEREFASKAAKIGNTPFVRLNKICSIDFDYDGGISTEKLGPQLRCS